MIETIPVSIPTQLVVVKIGIATEVVCLGVTGVTGFLAVGDVVWTTMITVVVGAFVTIYLARIAGRVEAIHRDAKETKGSVKEIKTTVANTEATVANVYKLSDHAYGAALRAAAIGLRSAARALPDNLDAQESAQRAEKIADEHDERQRQVDVDIAKRTEKIDAATTVVEKAKESPSPSYQGRANPIDPTKSE